MGETASDRLNGRLAGAVDELKRAARYTTPSILAGAQGPRITAEGRSFINLCANNYLGFASDPQVVAAAHAALDRYGFGTGGGRLVATLAIQEELERRLAAFKGREAALVCQTGYDTNLATLATLFEEGDVLLSDAANHASIVDGSRLARAARHIYPHGDGVLGRTGSGVVEHFGLHGRVALEIGTLSKALGGVGGFVAADRPVVEYLFQRARPFVFSTGHLPPMVAAGLVAALDRLAAEPARLARLWANAEHLRAGLRGLGFNTGASVTPIIPVMVGEAERATALSRALREAGVYAQAFAAPVVPEGAARVRVIVSAAHTVTDLDEALAAFGEAGRGLGLV